MSIQQQKIKALCERINGNYINKFQTAEHIIYKGKPAVFLTLDNISHDENIFIVTSEEEYIFLSDSIDMWENQEFVKKFSDRATGFVEMQEESIKKQ